MGPDLDPLVQPRGVQLLLHRRHRHDALMRVLEVQPSLLGLHRPGLEQKNAGDDLKTVSDAVLHLLKQNFLLLKQLVLFAISLTAPRHVLYREKNGRDRTIFVKHPAGIEQHHASANRRKFVLDLIGLYGAPFRNDVFEERPEARYVPLSVTQVEDPPAFRLAWRHCESPVERAARGNHAQVRVEDEKGLAYGIDDSLGQAVPVPDAGERIALGHARGSRYLLLRVDFIKLCGGIEPA